jgi:hypothetical protein
MLQCIISNLIKTSPGTEIFILDEISMLEWIHIFDLDKFCKELKGRPNVPFGGMIIVAAGDFYQ